MLLTENKTLERKRSPLIYVMRVCVEWRMSECASSAIYRSRRRRKRNCWSVEMSNAKQRPEDARTKSATLVPPVMSYAFVCLFVYCCRYARRYMKMVCLCPPTACVPTSQVCHGNGLSFFILTNQRMHSYAHRHTHKLTREPITTRQ